VARVNQELLMRYLLGSASGPEREQVEEEYFLDDETCEVLEALEDELIDSYVGGRLSQSQREQFEKYFLDYPAKQERVEFAKLFMDAAARETVASAPMRAVKQPNSWWRSVSLRFLGPRPAVRFAFTATWLVVATIAVFWGFQTQRLQRERTRLQHQIDQLEQEAKIGQQVLDVVMLPASHFVRDATSNNPYHVPAISRTSSIILLLEIERDEYPYYDAVLQSAEGKQIWHAEALRSRSMNNGRKAIALYLPSQFLNRGDYNILLSGRKANDGLQIVDSFEFSVLE